MKKLYLLLFFCAGLAYAQPDINENPVLLRQCETDGDGTATFNLSPVVPEILNSLDPSLYTSTFHFSNADAAQDLYPITGIFAFTNTVPSQQTLYVRVEEIADPASYSIATVGLFVNSAPNAFISTVAANVCVGEEASVQFTAIGGNAPYTFEYQINGALAQTIISTTNTALLTLSSAQAFNYSIQLLSVSAGGCFTDLSSNVVVNVVAPAFAFPVSPLIIEESPNDDVAVFDLTSKEVAITGGNLDVTVQYYTQEADAQSGTNPIFEITSFENTSNPQTIWARVQANSSGCFNLVGFDLVVSDPGIVYIPDANFKAGLIGLGFDANLDNQIQFTEVQSATTLTIDNLNIADLTGIKSFTSLLNLYAMDNLLTTADLSGMATLRLAYLGGNDLVSVNLSGVGNLRDLVLDQNQLEILQISDKPNLDRFSAIYNHISGLFLDDLPLLREINIFGNELASLDVAAFPNLQILNCGTNQLSSLNVIGASALKTLDCASNQLTNLNISGLSNLETVSFSDNPIQSHNWNGLDALKSIQFRNTGISNVDLPASATLQTMNCQANGISLLDVSVYPALIALNCSQNQIETLDVNANHQLQTLVISGNGMQELWAKNGVNEQFSAGDFLNNNFAYVCADESQVATILALAGDGVEVNSLCTATPGGVYNTIQGNVRFDSGNDGCDASDATHPFVKMHMVYEGEEIDVFTNDAAFYDFYVGDGNYTLTPVFENDYFNIVPTEAYGSFNTLDGSVSNHDFCLSAASPGTDAEIAIIPVIPARPDSDATYEVVVRNKGNQLLSQNAGLTLQFDGAMMDFVSASVVPDDITNGALIWNYSGLEPLESRRISVTFHINGATDTPAVYAGTELLLTAQVQAASDVQLSDNQYSYKQKVVNTYEPNYKTCLEGDLVPAGKIGEYLYYAINFGNSGTDVATDITIRDVLDPAMFDRSSLQVISSSHPVTARSAADGLTLTFKNVNMDSGGHGNILLKVRSNGGLDPGATVSNKAGVYFNYRTLVETNTANTTFESLSAGDVGKLDVRIYPNPVSDALRINSDSEISSVQLFDIRGRLLQVSLIEALHAEIDMSDKQNGLYFVKVMTKNGIRTEKIIKK